ncbi:MAG: dTDP-glucose 4,6-dehydratase [Deltaproteobacteria bacterium]|nr:dTDP-glucose 4,6-dehydratase [Deltaproteobacteria bacterium]
MRCLVTGGAGFIGSNFVRFLLTRNLYDKVAVVDNLSYGGYLDNLNGVLSVIDFFQVDISDYSSLAKVFEEFRPDHVYHFAAQSHVDRSILNPGQFISSNIVGSFNLFELSRIYKTQKFIHVSTDEVYGSANPGESFLESSPLDPSSPYSASKAGSDLLALSYYKTFNFPVVITRSSNNYGPYQLPEKFIPLAITNLLEGKPVPIYGTGMNIRNWLYVEDNCEAILTVGLHGATGEIYNIGGLHECEIPNLELAKILCDLLGRSYSLLEFVKDRPAHDLRYSLDSSKIKKQLNWEAKTKLRDGLHKTVEWYSTNRPWWEKRKKELEEYYKQNYGNR